MDIIEKILNNVEKTTKAVVQKSSDVVGMTKIKIAISNEEEQVSELISEMGKLVYDAYVKGEGNSEAIEEKCKKIEELRHSIMEKRDELARLRNLKRCPTCGQENDCNALYCNQCGEKLPEVDACKVDDMPEGSGEKEDTVIDVEDETEV